MKIIRKRNIQFIYMNNVSLKTSLLKLIVLLFFIPIINGPLLHGQAVLDADMYSECTGALKTPLPKATVTNQSQQLQNFNCDCKTDFFTVNTAGEIQQWTLNNNAITGGAVILTGGIRGGLAYCGDVGGGRTFYSGNYPAAEIKYYDLTSWKTIPTPFNSALNNGGFKNTQYYMSGLNAIYHYNGSTFNLVANLGATQMTVYDIAVDTMGQAWVFTGSSFGSTSQIRVYDTLGLKTSYNFPFASMGTYGAFFVDGTLYVAFSSGSSPANVVRPLIFNGASVQFGTPIPFPYTTYADIASCHCLSAPPPPPCTDLTPVAKILPGNISGFSQVQVAIKVSEVNGTDTDGTPISVRIPSDQRMAFVWDIGLTMAALTPVQNADWNYLGNNGLFHTWTYNGPNLIISKFSTSAFGFMAFYDPQSTSGLTSISSTIVPFSGGECNLINNADSESLIYFE